MGLGSTLTTLRSKSLNAVYSGVTSRDDLVFIDPNSTPLKFGRVYTYDNK